MDKKYFEELLSFYEKELAQTLDFWYEHGYDKENGGFYTCLERNGDVFDTDKAVWAQGRGLWVFSKAYNFIKKDERYLKASFYDDDKIEKGYPYSGERIKRGLYERNNKQLVNADINGALNIYKKYMLKSNSKNSKVSYLMSRGLTIPSRVLVTL